MGKKGGWFSAVKKAFSPQSKKDQKAKYKKKFNDDYNTLETTPSTEVTEQVSGASFPPPAPPLPAPPTDVEKPTEVDIDDEQNQRAYSVAVATEVVCLTTVPRFVGKSKEEISAIKIQTAFRGYLARRALRALRGLVRLKSLVEGQSVKRQAATTLRCMQTLSRVQSQIHARRIRMSEENQALQRQLQQKHEKELEKLGMGEIWDDSTQSKEQIEASLQSKQEATMRRERSLAYAFTHQQPRKNNKNSNPTFMDPNNPQWGWSWLERWMASRPWESRSIAIKESNDHGSVKSFQTLSVAGEINRAYALRDLSIDSNNTKPTPSRAQSSTPGSGKARPRTPKTNGSAQDEDTKSTMSVQSEKFRRHSIVGTSVRDDESLAGSSAVPSYMGPTKSVKARTKQPSPLGTVEKNNGTPTSDQKPSSVGSAKKRLSFPASPRVPRRHSVPGKFETTPVKDVPVQIFVNN